MAYLLACLSQNFISNLKIQLACSPITTGLYVHLIAPSASK